MLDFGINNEAIQGSIPIPLLTKNLIYEGDKVMAEPNIPKRYPYGQAPKICTVDGCDNSHHARGYCRKHYHHIQRHGKIIFRTKYDENDYVINDSLCIINLYRNCCIKSIQQKSGRIVR